MNLGHDDVVSLHILVFLPKKGSLDVSNNGDDKGPGKEGKGGEELVESHEVTGGGSTSPCVEESTGCVY